jgi:Fic family protein
MYKFIPVFEMSKIKEALEKVESMYADVSTKNKCKVVVEAVNNNQLYVAAREKIKEVVDEPITEDMIQTVHALVINGAGKSSYKFGDYGICNLKNGKPIYQGLSYLATPTYMKELVRWVNEEQGRLSPPLIAAIFHHEFVKIHPFSDGNGRTARLLTTKILSTGGRPLHIGFALENYFVRNKDAYMAALKEPSYCYIFGFDKTQWISYFLQSLVSVFENYI